MRDSHREVAAMLAMLHDETGMTILPRPLLLDRWTSIYPESKSARSALRQRKGGPGSYAGQTIAKALGEMEKAGAVARIGTTAVRLLDRASLDAIADGRES